MTADAFPPLHGISNNNIDIVFSCMAFCEHGETLWAVGRFLVPGRRPYPGTVPVLPGACRRPAYPFPPLSYIKYTFCGGKDQAIISKEGGHQDLLIIV